MTAKEIFKKVETFNKLAEEFGINERRAVSFVDNGITQISKCGTYREFKKAMNETFVKSYVELVLNYDDCKMNRVIETQWIDIWGKAHEAVIEFQIVDAVTGW